MATVNKNANFVLSIQTYKGARKHYASGYYVSRDGKTVWGNGGKDRFGLPKKKKVNIKQDKYGTNYVWSPKCGDINVVRMVADCYCPRIPNDGKRYVLVHKDGNFENDDASNFEWRAATPELMEQLNTSRKLGYYERLKIRIIKDGKIFQDGELSNPFYSQGEPQFAHHQVAVQLIRLDYFSGGKHTNGKWEVIGGPFFADISRCHIDDDIAGRYPVSIHL